MLLTLFAVGLAALYLLVRGYAQQPADTTYDQLLRASVLSMADSLQLRKANGRWTSLRRAGLAGTGAARSRVLSRCDHGGSLDFGYADSARGAGPPRRRRYA